MPSSDLSAWRDEFPILARKVYLNSCSQGALSRRVRAAYESYLGGWDAEGSPWGEWVGRYEQLRAAIAELLGAQAGDIAICSSVSAAVSALASALDFSAGRDTIVVSDFEFPAVAQVWHAQEGRRGARVVHVPTQGEAIPFEAFERAIDERTLLVAVAHVSYRTGARQDAAALARLAHERGALFLLDSYQAAGAMPIDAPALGVDALVGGNLKYLLGSAGLAYMYVAPALSARLVPASSGWFAQADIFAMDIYANTPAPGARRFEAGTPPIPSIYAALAGLELVREVGQEAIAAHSRALTDQLIAAAQRRGWRLATPVEDAQRGPMVAIRSRDVEALVGRLAEQSIVVSSRDGNLRVSPHFYNSHDDIERLVRALDACSDLL